MSLLKNNHSSGRDIAYILTAKAIKVSLANANQPLA